MEEHTAAIIASGDLELYVSGSLDPQEALRIESLIENNPHIKAHIDLLESHLLEFSAQYKKTPVKSLKANIERQVKRIERLAKFSWASIVLAVVVFLMTSLYVFKETKRMRTQQSIVNDQIKELTTDFDQKLEDLRNQFIVLQSPQTEKKEHESQYNEVSFNFSSYLNKEKRLGFLQFDNLPKLPESMCFQIWVSRNGVKENIGILSKIDKQQLIQIPFKEKGTIHITIEEKPGNPNPDPKASIVNIPIG